MERAETRLFPALLRFWRTRRGHSQLDLALAADVSARHISFLETGRAQPSRSMALLLGSVLRIPLRDQNTMLEAAGFAREFPEPGLGGELPEGVVRAIDLMMTRHEPFPLMLVDGDYNVLRSNAGAARLLQRFQHHGECSDRPNLFRMLFDPRLLRPYVADWPRIAHALVARLHRESLSGPSGNLRELLQSLFEYPGVPESWRLPDFTAEVEPALTLRLRRDDYDLSFLTTTTAFSAPQNVTLEELRIESYYPLNETTVSACERLARE